MRRSRCPILCLVLLVCTFAAAPAQAEDWARDLTSIESRQNALSQLQAEKAQLATSGDHVALVKVSNRIVELQLMLYDFDAALVAANEARRLAERFRGSDDEPLLVDTLNLCARVHTRRDENALALDLLNDSLQLSERLRYLHGQAESLTQIASAYSEWSKLREAEVSAAQALEIWRQLHDKQSEARTLIIQGETYQLGDKLQQSYEALQSAERIWREVGDSVQLAATLMRVNYFWIKQGQWQKALITLNDIQPLITDKDAEPFLAGQVAMSFGIVYENYGQLDTALGYYREALVQYQRAHEKAATIDAGNKVARVQASQGDYSQAIQQLEQGLVTAREIEKDLYVGLCHEGLGQVWLASGSYPQARREFQLAIESFARTENTSLSARAQSYLGQVEFLTGNFERANRAYREALNVFESLPDYTNEAALSFSLGKLALSQGRYDEAEKYLDRSIELTERLRENAASTDLRSSFLASVHDRYEAYVELLMARHDQHPGQRLDVKAFEASESGRARSLIDVLRSYQQELRGSSDPFLLKEEKKLQQDEQTLVDNKAKLLSSGASETERNKVDQELRELRARYETLQARINTNPRFTKLLRPNLDYESIRQAVTNSDTSLVEYSLGTRNSFAWLITKDGLRSYKLSDKQTIANAVNKLLKLLETPADTEAKQTQLQAATNEVSRLVIEPLSQDLQTARLIVVADGSLQYVPFQVLNVSANSHEPLLSKFDVIDAPSASALAVVKEERIARQAAPKVVVGFGDAVFSAVNSRKMDQPVIAATRSIENSRGNGLPPLFNAKRELSAIGELVGNDASFYVEYQATRDNLLKVDLSQYQILHVVTHGILDADKPELSGLFLSLVDEHDEPLNGFVGLADIYKMRAPVDLVVLSACHTAVGKDLRGEGLIGLTRGFMYAGASSVVASLWKVDDAATAELMKYFYTYLLRDGMTPPAALRAAQNKIRAQPKWQSPYYWAGFTFQGDYDLNLRVASRSRKPEVLLGASFAALLVFATGTFFYTRRLRSRRS